MRRGVETELIELDLAFSQLPIFTNVLVHYFDREYHVFQFRDVEVECFIISGIQIILLRCRDHLSIVLVLKSIILLKLKLR